MVQNRSRTPLIVALVAGAACLALALLLVIALFAGGVVFWGSTEDGQGPAAPAGDQEPMVPPGAAEGQPYLELSSSEDGPVVDVYIDFLCPHCATFHEAQGEDLQQMAQDGEITLRMHPRPMLDASSSPEGYSGRAANAAVCAYAEDPAQWYAAESALFTHQPGAEGLTDEELATDAAGVEMPCGYDQLYSTPRESALPVSPVITWPNRNSERSLKARYATTTSATPVATASAACCTVAAAAPPP